MVTGDVYLVRPGERGWSHPVALELWVLVLQTQASSTTHDVFYVHLDRPRDSSF